MELVEISPALLAALAVVVMVLMQALKWTGLVVDEDSSNAAQRIVVAVLAGGATLYLNYTVFLTVDFSDPLTAILQLVQVATALFLAATGAYHLLWDYVSEKVAVLFNR